MKRRIKITKPHTIVMPMVVGGKINIMINHLSIVILFWDLITDNFIVVDIIQ